MLAKSILSLFSRNPEQGVYQNVGVPKEGQELKTLLREYPDLATFINGKDVLDFGCGKGLQTIALARDFAPNIVYGLDINQTYLDITQEAIDKAGVGERARVIRDIDLFIATFDTIVSLNAFEHFSEPEAILQLMWKRLTMNTGRILISFGPPWYAPYGAHMMHFTKIPWLNLLFPEKAVMAIRSRYNKDGATKYEECEGGLNKMSVRRFRKIIRRSGLTVLRMEYRCVAGLKWLAYIPFLRELFINHVTCVLSRENFV